MPMCEKNGPDSPSGLARTARSARLRFCLFMRFVFIQGVCLSRRAQRADLFKTSIRLSAKGVCVMLVQDKHTPQSQHGSKGEYFLVFSLCTFLGTNNVLQQMQSSGLCRIAFFILLRYNIYTKLLSLNQDTQLENDINGTVNI